MTETSSPLVLNEQERDLVTRGNALLLASAVTGVTLTLLSLARNGRLSPALNRALAFDTPPAVGIVTMLAFYGLGARYRHVKHSALARLLHPSIAWVPLAFALFVAPFMVRRPQTAPVVLLHMVPMCFMILVGSLLTRKLPIKPTQIRWTTGPLPSLRPGALMILALAVTTDLHSLYVGHMHRAWFF